MYEETLKLKLLTSKPSAISKRLAKLSATFPSACCSTVLNRRSRKCPFKSTFFTETLPAPRRSPPQPWTLSAKRTPKQDHETKIIGRKTLDGACPWAGMDGFIITAVLLVTLGISGRGVSN